MGLASKRHPGIIYWILIIKPFLPAICCSLFLLSKGNFPYFVSFVKTNESLLQHRAIKKLEDLIQKGIFFFLHRNNILFSQEIYSKYVTPLQPIAKESRPYVSKHTVSQPLSPYYLSNNDSRKNFMSGI